MTLERQCQGPLLDSLMLESGSGDCDEAQQGLFSPLLGSVGDPGANA